VPDRLRRIDARGVNQRQARIFSAPGVLRSSRFILAENFDFVIFRFSLSGVWLLSFCCSGFWCLVPGVGLKGSAQESQRGSCQAPMLGGGDFFCVRRQEEKIQPLGA